jgi:uncharacterized protein
VPNVGRFAALRRLTIVLFAGLAVAAVAGCDSKSASPVGGNTLRQVTVVGNGKVVGTPDTLTADVAITSVAPDVTSAMNQSSDRQRAVIDALTGAGIDRKDISTTNVSLQSQYGDGNTITGYQASNSLGVRIRDIGAASQTLALIVSTGGDATRINSVDFSISDDSQLVKDARTRAFNDAKDRAQQFADLSGLTLGQVISITEAGAAPAPPVPMPMPMPRSIADAAPVPLEPGRQTVSLQVTAVWELG